MNSEKEFNLLYEPWIIVIGNNNQQLTVSMLDLFRNAHKYKCISGELPTQDIALLRLLLAVLYAVFTKVDVDGKQKEIKTTSDALSRWKSLWEKGEFPYEEIEQYLKYYEDRFWLFHPETPFYQVAGLDRGTEYGVRKLIGTVAESGNTKRLFPQRTGKAVDEISFSEAARWLIHLNAFDDASGKPVKESKDEKYLSPGVGWLGKLGLIYVNGNTVFETLLLNFTLLGNDRTALSSGEPIWEKKEIVREQRVKISIPAGVAELYTIQSRRLLLKRNAQVVVGFTSLGGDFFDGENAFIEPMTLWRTNNKKDEHIAFVPKRHDIEKQFWRDFASLAVQNDTSRIPGVISWIEKLEYEQYIMDFIVNIHAIAVQYDSKGSSIIDVFNDELSINGGLLKEIGKDKIHQIIKVISNTEKCISALAAFARELAKASGAAEKDNKIMDATASRAKELAYYSFDLPFRKWLANIDPMKDDMDQTSNLWNEQMRSQILQLGKELISGAGDSVFVGKSSSLNAPVAYTKFVNSINKIVPKIEEGKESRNE